MNPHMLLELIGEAKEKYVYAAAETRENRRKGPKRLSFRRSLLIAAVIASILLLAGCAVVYALRMQDLKIADETYVINQSSNGANQEPTEITRDVISIRGFPGSPNQLATKEWYEFLQMYDPEYARMTDENDLGIPDGYYYAYNCYTWDMVDKMDEIVQKYDLKLLSPETVIQRWQIDVMFDLLDIESVCHNDYAARVTDGAGYFYPEGNFKYEFELLLPQEDDNWPYEIWATMFYSQKEYFDPDHISIDIEGYEQWNYTTLDGSEILIAMQDNGNAFLFAEQENAYITVSLNTTMILDPSETRRATKRDMESAANIIDFTLQPQLPDMTDLDTKLAEADRKYEIAQEQLHQKRMEGYQTYGAYIKEMHLDKADKQAGTPYERTYYALLDVTGDGEAELLLGNQQDHFRDLLTIKEGKVQPIHKWSTMNLCGENIIMMTEYIDHFNDPVAQNYYSITEDGNLQSIVSLNYDLQSSSWQIWNQDSEQYQTISESEYTQIVGQYTLVPVEMKPITEYPFA